VCCKSDIVTALEYYHGEEISSAMARQHGIRQKRDDGDIGKTLAAFCSSADEGTLSRLMVEPSILLAASRSNPTRVLRDAASTEVDTEAIAAKAKQEFDREG
jgi:ParB family transcriptional regulator, chromosome partitioning protein